MARGRRKKTSRNSRRKGHQSKQKSFDLNKRNHVQEQEKPDYCCRTMHDPDSEKVTENIDPIMSKDVPDSHISSPFSISSKESTSDDKSGTVVTSQSEESVFSNETIKTLIISNTDNLLYKSPHSLQDCSGPHLLSQDFLITHSKISEAAVKDPYNNRKAVLKVPQPDFASLSDKICVTCLSRINGSDEGEPVHSPCQDLSKQTKVILQRISQTQESMKGNRQGIDCKLNVREPALKISNNDILSTDMNGNVTELYVNEIPGVGNHCENAGVKPSYCKDHVALREEHVLTKSHLTSMFANMNDTKEDKRKLPPLRIPKEKIFFHDDEDQDDSTPEYPLKEGDIFLKSMKESFTKTTEPNRNFFSDFPSTFSFQESQSLASNNEVKKIGDTTEMVSQKSPRTDLTSNMERIKLPKDLLRLSKSSEPPADKFRRENLHLEGSEMRHEAGTNRSSHDDVSTANKASFTDSGQKNRHEVEIKKNERVHVTMGSPGYCTLPSPQAEALNSISCYSVVTNVSKTVDVTATSQTQNEIILHGENNQIVNNADSEKGNLSEPIKLGPVKQPLQNLPQLNESTLNLRDSGNSMEIASDKLFEIGCLPNAEDEISVITEIQNPIRSIAQTAKCYSSDHNTNKEESSLVKTIFLNLKDAKSPSEDESTATKSSQKEIENQSCSSENKYVTTFPPKDTLENISSLSFLARERVSCEISMSETIQPSSSVSSPSSQVKTLKKEHSLVYSKSTSDSQQSDVENCVQKEDTSSYAAIATNSAVNMQVYLTSEKCISSTTYNKDHQFESSTSERDDETEQLQKHYPQQVILTTRMSQSSLTKNKLPALIKPDGSDTNTLTLLSKRPIDQEIDIVNVGKDLTSGLSETVEKHKTPRKKIRGNEFCSEDQMVVDNISTKYAMTKDSDLQPQRTMAARKHQSTFGNDVRSLRPLVPHPANQENEGQSVSQQEVSATEGQLIPGKIFDVPLLRDTLLAADKHRYMPMGNQLSPGGSSCLSLGRHVKFKIGHNLDTFSETSLSVKTNAPISRQQPTKNVAESNEIRIDMDKKTVDQPSEKLQSKMKSLSSSLLGYPNNLIAISEVSSNSSKLPPQSAKSSQKNVISESSAVLNAVSMSSAMLNAVSKSSAMLNAVSKSSAMLNTVSKSSAVLNSGTFIVQPIERSTYHNDIESSKRVQSGKKKSNQLEPSVNKSSVHKVNSGHHPENSNCQSSRMYNHFQLQTPQPGNCKSISLTLPDVSPLWANMPFKTYRSTENNKNSLVPFQICSEPQGQKVVKNGNNNDNRITIPPHRDNLYHGNQQTPKDYFPWSVSTVSFENFNMLKHAQAIQLAQQNTAVQQIVQPEEQIKYPSWVQVPHEQTISNGIVTVASKLLNSQTEDSAGISETKSKKFQNPVRITPSSGARVTDPLSGSDSLLQDNNRLPTVNEPLDLSRHSLSGKNAPHKGSAQQQLQCDSVNINTQASATRLPGASVKVCHRRFAEIDTPLAFDKSYHVSSNVDTDDSSRGPITPSTKLTTLPITASTASLLASVSSAKPPHTLIKDRLLEAAVEQDLIAGNGIPLTINSATPATPSCKGNEQRLFVHTTGLVDQHTQKHSMHVGITNSSSLQENSPVTSGTATTCSAHCRTNAESSLPALITVSLAYSSAAQPSIVSSTSDITETEKSKDSVSTPSLHTFHTSLSLSTPGQTSSAHSVQSMSRHHTGCLLNNFESPSSRLAPLPIKDFFTQTPKENTYSSLLMAKITSKNKKHLDLEKDTGSLPFVQSKYSRDEYTFSINNSLQKNLVIDLTDECDDCDVISVSSKNSFDDESANDFLDVILPDRASTPASVATCSGISEIAVVEGSKDLISADLPSESTVCVSDERYMVQTDERDLDCASLSAGSDYTELSGLVSINITEAEGMSPGCITENNQVLDLRRLKENHELNKMKCYNISDAEEPNETDTTAESQSQTHSALTRSVAVSSSCLTKENSILSSHLLKDSQAFEDIISRNDTNDEAKGKPPEVSTAGDCIEEIHFEIQQPYNSQVVGQSAGTNISAHDKSTQRAAATLLELSANPLYNSYMIIPETSDTYQEKVYQIHPTLADSSTVRDGISQEQPGNGNDSHGTRRAQGVVGSRSRTRTGRRVGRPLKDQYIDSQGVISTESESTCITTSPSVQSVRTLSGQVPNSNIVSMHNKSFYAPGQSLGIFYGLQTKACLESTSPTNSTAAMSRVFQNEFNRNLSQQSKLKTISDVDTVSLPHSVNTFSLAAGVIGSQLSKPSNKIPFSKDKFVQKNENVLFGSFSTVHNNSLSNNSNVSAAVSRTPLFFSASLSKADNNIYTGIDGKQIASVNIPDRRSKVNSLSHELMSSPRFSTSKARTKPGNEKRKRGQRNVNVQEKVQLIDAPLNEVSENEHALLNIESSTTQRSLHIDNNNTEANAYKRLLPKMESNNEHPQTDTNPPGRKKRKVHRNMKELNVKQKSSRSDIDEVLQMLNSREEIANIVVSTSLEDGLQILSLRQKADADYCQQNPHNGDQIVPVNLANMGEDWVNHDAENNIHKESVRMGNASIVCAQGLQKKMPVAVTSEPSGYDDSTELTILTGSTLLGFEAVGETEKERAVTSLLAEMMHSKFKEGVHGV